MLLTLCLSLFFSCTDDTQMETIDPHKRALENLAGTYQDETPYAYGEAFGQRTFTFDEGKWTLEFTLGLDPQLEMKVFQFRTYGTYQVLEPSAIVSGAYDALFWEEKKFLTLYTDNPELVQAFGFGSCGLEQGIEKDISTVGCSAWAAVSECNEDHDLLSLDEAGRLYFGERPADNNMCTADKRPTRLTPGVSKVQ